MVMDREDDGNSSLMGLENERRGQVVEVPEMQNFWTNLIQRAHERGFHSRVTVPIAGPRHVDDMKGDSSVGKIGLALCGVLGEKGILLPREGVDLLPQGERLCQALSIHLGARVAPDGVAMNDLENPQQCDSLY